MTQLVFTDTIKQSTYARKILCQIHELAALLRTGRVVREMGEKCPSVCQTRWLYIVDVLLWMCQREEKITAFLVASDNNRSGRIQFPAEWKRILLLFLPLKRLNLAMESSGCALWELIPIVCGMVNGWKKVMHLFSDEEALTLKILMTNLIVRLSATANATVVASYALSELGRSTLRRREEGFQTRGSEHSCFTTERIASFETFLDDIDATLTAASEHVTSVGPDPNGCEFESTESGATDDLEMFLASGQLEDADSNPMEKDIVARNELMSLSLDALLNVDIYKFGHAKALAEITRIGRILGIEECYIQEKFSAWLYAPREDTPTALNVGQSPDIIWRCVPANCEDWRQFAEVALRFVTIATSEADCERMLSRQKDVQGIRTSNIRTDLLETLLRA